MTGKERAMKLFCPYCKDKAYPIYIKDPNYRRIDNCRWCKKCKLNLQDKECWTTKFAKHYTANMSARVRNRYRKTDPILDTEERLQSDLDTQRRISND